MATAEKVVHPKSTRGWGARINDSTGHGRPLTRNKQWVASDGGPKTGNGHHSDGERWERGGYRGRGRGARGIIRGGRKYPNATLRNQVTTSPKAPIVPEVQEDEMTAFLPETSESVQEAHVDDDEDAPLPIIHEPTLDTLEEREKFYKELVEARKRERERDIAAGKLDNPAVQKLLSDAITLVGTCPDMCPRFERYRREREKQLDPLEKIPGTHRVNHQRAVKRFERASGDKIQPSDIRPPHVLKKTLDYLFHDLLPRVGLAEANFFVRDRSRAVRNDFTIQHETGPLAIDCYTRCARYHIATLHLCRTTPGFDTEMEAQQMMYTLLSLKQFYDDQRGKYESPTELEMRIYDRFANMRTKIAHEDRNTPQFVLDDPGFKLVTQFRSVVQDKSPPLHKRSLLVVDDEAMQIFRQFIDYLQGNMNMKYLVACILEHLFGTDTLDDIESIRGDLSITELIDGITRYDAETHRDHGADEEIDYIEDIEYEDEEIHEQKPEPEQVSAPVPTLAPTPAKVQASSQAMVHSTAHSDNSPPLSAFSTLVTTPNVFGGSVFAAPAPKNIFGGSIFGPATSTTVPTSSSTVQDSNRTISSGVFSAPSRPSANGPSIATSHPQLSVAPSSISSNPSSIFGESNAKPSPPPISAAPTTTITPAPPTFNDRTSFHSVKPPALNPSAPVFSPFSSSSQQQSSFPTFPIQPDPDPAQPKPPPPPFASPLISVTPAEAAQAPTISRISSSSSSSSNKSGPTPPPLKIDVGLTVPSSTPPVPSPREPPTLGRVMPVSLPSTPTGTPAPSAVPNHIKGLTTPSGSSLTSGILSPLALQSPSGFYPFPTNSLNSSPKGTPMSNGNRYALGLLGLDGKQKNKGKSPERRPEIPDTSPHVLERMEEKALAFERYGLVLKSAFQAWVEKAVAKAAYVEACRRDDLYREKIREEEKVRDRGGTPDKKRRISVASQPAMESPQRKRPRKRVSTTYQPPRTDDELVQRLKERYADHERRWAPGTFLELIRTYVNQRIDPKRMPSSWQIWVSTNPVKDQTACWVQTKFNIPNSGGWESEHVFSIPISKEHRQNEAHPGLIVFECTPLDGVNDEIERKYLVLDDCSRLREIVQSFPKRRYYEPSLLVICWAHDSDAELSAKLEHLDLDLEGERVQSLTIKGVGKEFYSTIRAFAVEWVDSCSNPDYFNWKLYNLVAHTFAGILNDVAERICRLCNLQTPSSLPLPELQDNAFEESDSAYELVDEWLSNLSLHDQNEVEHIIIDLESHRNIEQDFPGQIFLDHLLHLSQMELEQAESPSSQRQHLILTEDLSSAHFEFEESLQPLRIELSRRLNATTRRTPKRRGLSTCSSVTSPESKRARLSTASLNGDYSPLSSPMLTGELSPSPSVISLPQSETTSTAQPVYTAADLRDLIKNVKKKYLRPS
ncbi:hypothetical protein FA15DRAFT_689578 [Coprinopsis marcescibilis]|uniref:SAC3/GANP/THP3 conserved domain-containing protein n=1 Tax=Coprinopsis marcescibilis TaxID=230819 RepID=A0A5C3KH88_COPMA|nr:hypothetical protein FA15DRAFT_689578 [Coprinopsis marcescibilis]